MPKKPKILLHPEAANTYKIIRAHSAVVNVDMPQSDEEGGFVIRFKMEVSLPSRCRQQGVTETGVKLIETVKLYLPPSYPFRAPIIYLRKDFNNKLPHIQPLISIDIQQGITPCIYDGNLNELLLRNADGLTEIINYLSEWLGKAAINDLIDIKQGWEPIRRDLNSGWLVYDLSEMRDFVVDDNGYAIFRGRFVEKQYDKKNMQFIFGIINQSRTLKLSAGLMNELKKNKEKDGTEIFYDSLVFFLWPDKNIVANQYSPDTVKNFQQFVEDAKVYGCNITLQNAINELFFACDQAGWRNVLFPIFIILCARRPVHLIGGNDSNLELIAYKIDCILEKSTSLTTGVGLSLTINQSSSVTSLGHRHMINKKLLRQMSGYNLNLENGPIVMIGCGSLGSKIAMHLARSGCGPFYLIDSGIFAPHNAARHALTFPEIPILKTALLSEEIKSLRQTVMCLPSDVIDILDEPENIKKYFPADTSLIIETTGSVAVREKLVSLNPKKLSGRLFHAALYESGRIGVIAIEGNLRNPNIDDLLIKLWDARVSDEQLFSIFTNNKNNTSRQNIGMGCGSYTTVMPDTHVSVYAAGMAEKARDIIENGPSENGELWIGILDESNMGVQWKRSSLKRTVVLKTHCSNEWEIRILADAYSQIKEEAEKWKNIETGGVLIGRIFINRRCITVARVIEAPVDSTRSENSFILGTKDLRKNVSEIFERSGGTLSYVGTWHSHPNGSKEPSLTDKKSYEKLKKLRLGAPAAFLIWTTNDFGVILDEGKLC
ncbi:MAG: Mov34/MPN/PAD-1 family protein [Bacteroidetes bacterium]|nr:Mov34/MPN/PAD-1 family protein [Bacteroidota bacterium]